MPIVETRSWKLGRFTICQQPRFDSPAWPQYLIFVSGRLIGKQFSCPCESDAVWLERSNGEVYATRSRWLDTSYGRRGHVRPGRARADRDARQVPPRV